jgi:uncharacterized membrane protein
VTKPDSLLASIDEVFILRLAFIFSAQFALYEGFQDYNRGSGHAEAIVLTLVIYAASLLVFAMSLLPSRVVLKFRDLPLLLLLLATVTGVYVVAEISYRGAYRTDVLAFSHYAAILFVNQGANPYTQDMTRALDLFKVQPSDLTPLTSGTYLMTFQYPALHFLVFVPFVLLGLRDMRWVLVLFEVGIVLTLYVKGQRKLRPMLLLPLFAGSDLMINFTAASVSDSLWVLPLLFAAFCLERPIALGVFYGLACSMKQTPWFLAPFLLIYLIKTDESKRPRERLWAITKFALATIVLFLAINLMFILPNPGAWFGNVMTPMTEDLVIHSQGLSALTEAGMLSVGKVFYTLVFASVFLVLILNYYVYFDKLRFVFWIFPGIALWFSYRALTNYIIYWTPLMLVSIILWYKAEQTKAVQTS